MRHLHPGQNQKACVVGEQAQVTFARFRAPANETIAARQVPRGRTPRQTSNRLAFGRDQILQVFAHRLLVAEIVILLQQAVEQRFLRRAPHLLKRQWA